MMKRHTSKHIYRPGWWKHLIWVFVFPQHWLWIGDDQSTVSNDFNQWQDWKEGMAKVTGVGFNYESEWN